MPALLPSDIGVGNVHGKAILQSTLRLKLQCLSLGKLLSHNAALYNPTTRQMTSAMVLAHISASTQKTGCWLYSPHHTIMLTYRITVYSRVCLCRPILRLRAIVHVVEARVSSRPWWSAAEWATWCRSLMSGGGKMWKADLPLARAAIGDSKDAKVFAMKKPAIGKKPATSDGRIKRGPFTLRREGGLITGGVKRLRFKQTTA